uniref:Uncharacterized protein n=1 Tax=Vespula pensylvanica TaxID=30213 RepID=A0A834K2J5_VESPE|nr:hypothetical protein H0235_016165 [Vespula pensylvanica]
MWANNGHFGSSRDALHFVHYSVHVFMWPRVLLLLLRRGNRVRGGWMRKQKDEDENEEEEKEEEEKKEVEEEKDVESPIKSPRLLRKLAWMDHPPMERTNDRSRTHGRSQSYHRNVKYPRLLIDIGGDYDRYRIPIKNSPKGEVSKVLSNAILRWFEEQPPA